MLKKTLVLLFLLAPTLQAFPQAINVVKNKVEITTENKKKAVEMLRETLGEVNNLRTLENRIAFSSELSAMLWTADEKAARADFAALIGDFNQMLSQYNAQAATLDLDPENTPYYGGGFFGGGGGGGEKTKLMRKISQAMGVRQQIAASLAEHDPKWAFDFYDDSLQMISDSKLRTRFEDRDSYFKSRLLSQISENDIGTALEIGRKSLKDGVNYGHLGLLEKMYAKDAEKGAEFGKALADRLKTEKISGDKFYLYPQILRIGAKSLETVKNGKKPIFDEQTLRELAEIYGQTMANNTGRDVEGTESLDLLEKFAPSRAAQIKLKMKAREVRPETNVNAVPPPLPVPPPRRVKPASELSSKQKIEQLTQTLRGSDTAKLGQEERAKMVAQARKTIAEESVAKPEKIMALSALAAQVAQTGDQELAGQILGDAQSLVAIQPKNYQDYLEILMLASGYAHAAPEKAFPLLEDAIFRINETIAAMVKVGEFIDVSGEMIDGGEVQIGTLGGGGGGLGEMTRGLALADDSIRLLAVYDLDKTKALANRFDRPEARILAKMLILRAVLENKTADESAIVGQ